MRAKLIYEKFKEDSDPVHDMNIGYKDYKDYLKKELPERTSVGDIVRIWIKEMSSENSKEDLLTRMLEILEQTSIDFQIDFANDIIETYNYYKIKYK